MGLCTPSAVLRTGAADPPRSRAANPPPRLKVLNLVSKNGPTFIQKAFKKVKKELGPITCLINNASSFVLDDINTSNRKLWDRHLQTNLRAPFLLCQLMAKMLPKNLQGNIVNISSASAGPPLSKAFA